MNPNVLKKLDSFFKYFQLKKFKKNEILIKGGNEPRGLFFLKEGAVKQVAISPNGEESTVNIFKAPSLFPMAWAINDTLSTHYFEAMTPVTVWIAPKKEALIFLQREPAILLDLLKRIYYGLEGFFTRVEYLMAGNAQKKVIIELILSAKRFGIPKNNGMLINLKLTQKELASQSGIARETVSRELQKLKQKGLISFQRSIFTIKNLQKLEEELQHT